MTDKNLNRQAIAEWVAALRSGKYQQGFGSLRQTVGGMDAYCCLGVACDLFADRLNFQARPVPCDGELVYEYGEARATSYLPSVVAHHLGFNNINPCIRVSEDSDHFDRVMGRFGTATPTLSGLNDSGSFTFDHIADFVEATYLQENTEAAS